MKDDIIKKLQNNEYPYETITEFPEETLKGIQELFFLLKRVHIRLKNEGYVWKDDNYQKIISEENNEQPKQ